LWNTKERTSPLEGKKKGVGRGCGHGGKEEDGGSGGVREGKEKKEGEKPLKKKPCLKGLRIPKKRKTKVTTTRGRKEEAFEPWEKNPTQGSSQDPEVPSSRRTKKGQSTPREGGSI